MEKAGYRKLPPHSSDKNPPDESWVTQSKWNKNEFPRMHLTRTKGVWDLHYDYYKLGDSQHRTDDRSQIVRNEMLRLKKLSKLFAYKAISKRKSKTF